MAGHDLGRIPGTTTNFERAQAFASSIAQQRANANAARQAHTINAERAKRQENLTTVKEGLAQAEAESEAAQQLYADSWARGDGAGVARAQAAIAETEARKHTLAAGLDELQEQVAEVTPRQGPVYRDGNVVRSVPQLTASEQVDRSPQFLPAEKDWANRRRDDLNRDPLRVQVAFADAMRKGLQRGTPEFFGFLNDRIDNVESNRPEHLVRLSPAEQQAARDSGITLLDYARQKAKLTEAKKLGMYGDR